MGIVFLIIGLAMLYWINRRKFNRRGIAGIEEFKSYENAVFSKIIEWIGKWIAYVLIALSMLYFWKYHKHNKIQNSKEVQNIIHK